MTTYSRTACGAAYLLTVSMFSAVPSLAADAVEWGQAVNGLRISISIVPVEGGPGDLQLAFQNIGDKDLPVGISYWVNCQAFQYAKVFFKDSEGEVRTVRRTGGGVGGRRNCAVLIPPGAERSFRQPERIFVFNTPTHSLATLSQPGELWVEYEPPAASVKDACGTVPCWLGKVVSNTLMLPAH